MALKRLSEQIQHVENGIVNAQLYPSPESVGVIHAEYKKLRMMVESLSSFVSHRWQVKLFTPRDSVIVHINAENLIHAIEIAEEAVDDNDDVVRFELYCDGVQIPHDEMY